MAQQKFRVVRAHIGDKPYAENDTRVADPSDVKHLVPHVLEPMKAKAKSAPKGK